MCEPKGITTHRLGTTVLETHSSRGHCRPTDSCQLQIGSLNSRSTQSCPCSGAHGQQTQAHLQQDQHCHRLPRDSQTRGMLILFCHQLCRATCPVSRLYHAVNPSSMAPLVGNASLAPKDQSAGCGLPCPLFPSLLFPQAPAQSSLILPASQGEKRVKTSSYQFQSRRHCVPRPSRA